MNAEVDWYHFGDGFEHIKKAINENLPANVQFHFKGHVDNTALKAFYKKQTVDFFITLSASEGLPVSLMEAGMFGIPLVGSAVYGVPEIVNDTTGLLVPDQYDCTEVAQQIISRLPAFKTATYREQVREFTKTNFYDVRNYTEFAKKLAN